MKMFIAIDNFYKYLSVGRENRTPHIILTPVANLCQVTADRSK